MVDKPGMSPLRCPSAALPARQILEALESADVSRLEEAMERVAERARACPRLPTDRLERLELLAAIAEGLRCALARVRRGLTDRLEGAHAQLRLLRHLAETG